ncbi:uncharacterized protein A4U43_C09F6530 [Asparagus officinalis]|uniref:Uncharacterized protein n=1 Tax=Asparagus officinalis TaxID=4686 RepID=A0A5P1E608_ASPOF|nr:uncharacterized protein A4U43_C09F6530 [Asparagus officinalis]
MMSADDFPARQSARRRVRLEIETRPPLAGRCRRRSLLACASPPPGPARSARPTDLVSKCTTVRHVVKAGATSRPGRHAAHLDAFVEVKLGNYQGRHQGPSRRTKPRSKPGLRLSCPGCACQAHFLRGLVKDKDLVTKDDSGRRVGFDLARDPDPGPARQPLAPAVVPGSRTGGGFQAREGEIMLAVWDGQRQARRGFPDAWHSDAHSSAAGGPGAAPVARSYFSPSFMHLRVHRHEAQEPRPRRTPSRPPPDAFLKSSSGGSCAGRAPLARARSANAGLETED